MLGVLLNGHQARHLRGHGCAPRATPQSLVGHTSPVECVNFDANEEVVAAGGQNGTVKLWDLNSSKGGHTARNRRAQRAARGVCRALWCRRALGLLVSASL